MKRSKFSETQTAAILNAAGAGLSVQQISLCSTRSMNGYSDTPLGILAQLQCSPVPVVTLELKTGVPRGRNHGCEPASIKDAPAPRSTLTVVRDTVANQ